MNSTHEKTNLELLRLMLISNQIIFASQIYYWNKFVSFRQLIRDPSIVIFLGINPETLKGSRTGVFVGASSSEAGDCWSSNAAKTEGFAMIGCQRAMFSNRLSYFFDFKGEKFIYWQRYPYSGTYVLNSWNDNNRYNHATILRITCNRVQIYIIIIMLRMIINSSKCCWYLLKLLISFENIIM